MEIAACFDAWEAATQLAPLDEDPLPLDSKRALEQLREEKIIDAPKNILSIFIIIIF